MTVEELVRGQFMDTDYATKKWQYLDIFLYLGIDCLNTWLKCIFQK